MAIDNNSISRTLAASFRATNAEPSDKAAVEKFVNDASGVLTLTAGASAGDLAAIYAGFFKQAGFDPQARQNFIAALHASPNVVINSALADSLEKALAGQRLYDAPLPEGATWNALFKADTAPDAAKRAGRFDVLNGAGPRGKGIDMFDVPAHIYFVPQHRTADSTKGGGAQNGVAAAAQQRLQAKATKAGIGAAELSVATRAVDAWETKLASSKDPVDPGTGTLALTGIENPNVFAAAVFHCGTVPPAELRMSANTTEAELKSSQPERIAYAISTLSAGFQNMAAQADTALGTPDPWAPRVVVMPMLQTGPAGLLSDAEAGWVMGTVARSFLKDNPGYQLVVAPYGSYRPSEFNANRDSYSVAAAAKTDTPPGVSQNDVKTTGQQFGAIAKGNAARLATHPNEAVNIADAAVLSSAIADVSAAITKAIGSGDYGDRFESGAKVTAAADSFVSDAYWHAQRMCELPAKKHSYGVGPSVGDDAPLEKATGEAIRALLASPTLQHEVLETLRAQIGGTDEVINVSSSRLRDLVAMAVARTLQQSRHDYVNDSTQRMSRAIESLDDRVQTLRTTFGQEHGTLVDLLQATAKEYEAALHRGDEETAARAAYEKRIAQLSKDNTLLQLSTRQSEAKLADTEKQLQRAVADLATAQRELSSARYQREASAPVRSRSSSSYSG